MLTTQEKRKKRWAKKIKDGKLVIRRNRSNKKSEFSKTIETINEEKRDSVVEVIKEKAFVREADKEYKKKSKAKIKEKRNKERVREVADRKVEGFVFFSATIVGIFVNCCANKYYNQPRLFKNEVGQNFKIKKNFGQQVYKGGKVFTCSRGK